MVKEAVGAVFGKTSPKTTAGRLSARRLFAEPLEERALLSITTFVDDFSNWSISVDQGAAGLDAGDTVVWQQGTAEEVIDLTWGTDAFDSIQDAIDATDLDGTVRIAGGTYDQALNISQSLNLVGSSLDTPQLVGSSFYTGITVTGLNTDVEIENLKVQDWFYGIIVQEANASMENVAVLDSASDGILVTLNGHVDLLNSQLSGNRVGMEVGLTVGGSATIQNADLTGNVLRGVQSFANSDVEIRDSNLSGYAGGQAIVNLSSSSVVDASRNWWGSTDASAVLGMTTGAVDITPMLSSGADSDPGIAFTPDTSAVHVTTLGAQAGSVGRVQEGVDLANAGGTVTLLAGTYPESVTIPYALTIQGPNTGIAGTATRGAEATITGSGTENVLVTIASDNVTIDGIMVDGSASAAAYGIVSDPTADPNPLADNANNNTVIQNCVVQTVNGQYASGSGRNFGILLKGTGAVSQGSVIANNLVKDVYSLDGWSAAIGIANNAYASITGNTVLNAKTGLTIDGFTAGTFTGATALPITGNTITAWETGIEYSNIRQNSIPMDVSGNDITGVAIPAGATAPDVWVGISGTNLHTGSSVLIENNTIDGDAAQANVMTIGYLGAANASTKYTNFTIRGGTVSNVDVGVGAINFTPDDNPELQHDTGSADVTVDGVSINLNSSLAGSGSLSGLTILGSPTGVAALDLLEMIEAATGTPMKTGANVLGIDTSLDMTVTGGTVITGGAVGAMVKGADTSLTIDNTTLASGTDILLPSTSGTVSIGDNVAFHGSNFYIDNRSVQDLDLSGLSGITFDVTDNFRIEDTMYHAVDNASLGLVTWVANNLFVTDAGTDHSIQRAIGLASSGDTVHVEAGTYAEALSVNVEGISVLGAGIDASVITPAGMASNGAGVYISADEVTFSGFTVDGQNSSVPRYGVKTGAVDGVEVSGVKATNIYRSAFDFLGSTDVTIEGIYAINNGGVGLSLVDVKDAVISNITTANNAWGGVTVSTCGAYTDGISYGIVISGTNSFGEAISDNGALQIEEDNRGGTTNPQPISFSTNLGDNADVTFLSSDFNFFLSGPQDDGNVRYKFFSTLEDAENGAAGSPGHLLEEGRYIRTTGEFSVANDFYVYDLANDSMAIQTAINKAAAGDTVNVGPGTYVENLNVNKALILVSTEGRDATTIEGSQAGSVAAGGGNLGTICVFTNGIAIGTATDGSDGFTILGYDVTTPGIEHAAVYYKAAANSDLSLIGNTITADGEAAIVGEYGHPDTSLNISYNNIGGKTYTGNTVGGTSSVQYTVANVPRSMVYFGGNTKGIEFGNNTVTGSVGGLIEGTTDYYYNTGVTIDGKGATSELEGAYIHDNTFGIASWATLRARGAFDKIENNTFDFSLVDASDAQALGVYYENTDSDTISGTCFLGDVSNNTATGSAVDTSETFVLNCDSSEVDYYSDGTGVYIVGPEGTDYVVGIDWLEYNNETIPVPTVPAIPMLTENLFVDDDWADGLNDPVIGQPVEVTYKGMTFYTIYGLNSFAAIQPAVDTAVAGDVVHVFAGTYTETITIDESISLLGPNANFNPKTDAVPDVADQAVIMPDVDDAWGTVLTVTGGDVTIRGLTFDGDNPNLTSDQGNTRNGVDINSAEAIYTEADSVTISNNIVKNFGYAGIDADGGNGAVNGNTISENLITNIGCGLVYEPWGPTEYFWGIGVVVGNGLYADITDNVITESIKGVQTNNYHRSTGIVDDTLTASISNNVMSVTNIGIFYNLMNAGTDAFEISGNEITAADPTNTERPDTPEWAGILFSSLANLTGDLTISGNTITGPASGDARVTSGIEVWNCADTARITVDATNTISSVDYGIFANNYEGYNGNAGDGAHVTIDGASISASEIGIYVLDSPNNTAATPGAVVVTVTGGTTIAGAGIGVKVDGEYATLIADDLTLDGFQRAIQVLEGSLDLSNSTIKNSGYHGLYVETGVATSQEISLTGVDFLNNNTNGATNVDDVAFFLFNGTATLDDVSIISSNAAGHAIQFRGAGTASDSTTWGDVDATLNGVTVDGTIAKNALLFQCYSDVSGVSLTNVDLTGAASGWSDVALDTLNNLNLGNTKLKNLDIWGIGGVDATSAEFYDLADSTTLLTDGFAIENQVLHAIDATGLGAVVWDAGNWYLTPESFVAGASAVVPGYIEAAQLQRAVAAAAAGDTINIKEGTYTEGAQVVFDKDVTVIGEGMAATIMTPGFNTGSVGDSRAWWLVNAGVDVEISNLAMDGTGSQVHQAIRSNGTTDVDRVAFSNIRYGQYLGSGYVAMGAGQNSATNSTFENMGRIGAMFFGAGTQGIYEGNTYTGKGVVDGLDYALEVGGGAVVTAADNTVTNNLAVASVDGSGSAAFMVTTYFGDGSALTLTGENSLTGNSTAVFVGYNEDDNSLLTISGANNTFTGNNVGIDIIGGTANISGANLAGNEVGIVVSGGTNVTVTGSDLTGYTGVAGNYAIENLNETAAGDPNVMAQGNNFGPYVTLSMIEDLIFDDTDDAAMTQVIYTGALNQQTAPAVVWVDDDWAGSTLGTAVGDLDGDSIDEIYGVDAFAVIQDGVDAVQVDGTINVLAGTYYEDVNVNKTVDLLGSGIGSSIVLGVVGGSHATFDINANGVLVDGFTISRDGNTVATWNDALNTVGIALQTYGNAEIRNTRLEGNRTGIDINDSDGNYIHNNEIDDNRTGIILRNANLDNTITQNDITNNWTVGVLWLQTSVFGDATGTVISGNNISGNWYAQVENRDTNGGVKDFSGNWFGTSSPVVSDQTAGEPGYSDLIPVSLGGTAEAPVTKVGDILGAGLSLTDYSPWLATGTDADTVAIGFQGDFSTLYVDDDSAKSDAGLGYIDEAIGMVTDSTIYVNPGIYAETVTIDKPITLEGIADSVTGERPVLDASGAAVAMTIVSGDVSVSGLDITGDASTLLGVGIVTPAAGMANVSIADSKIHDITGAAIQTDDNGSGGIVSNVSISGTEIDNIGVLGVASGVGINLMDVDAVSITGMTVGAIQPSSTQPGVFVIAETTSSNVNISANTYNSAVTGLNMAILSPSVIVDESASIFNEQPSLGYIVDFTNIGEANFTLPQHAKVRGLVGWGDATAYTPSIQTAVDYALDDGTINVTAGTFTEQIVIDKALSIVGQGMGFTTIASPATLPATVNIAGYDHHAVILAQGTDGVNLSALTVDGANQGDSNYRFDGILYYDASGTISGVEVANVMNSTFSGAQHGVGVYAYANADTARTVNLENSNIHDFQKNATAFAGANLTANVLNNTITGAGQTTTTAQNGIQISGGATGVIQGNTVSDIWYTGSGWTASAIITFGSGNVTIEDNIVSNSQVGAYVSGTGATSLINNQFTGGNYGVTVYSGAGTGVATIEGNTFDGQTYGIANWGDSAKIIDNDFIDNSLSIYLSAYAGSAKTLVQDNRFSFVSTSAADSVGIYTDSGAVVDAGQLAGIAIDFTGLGVSTGGNDFSTFTSVDEEGNGAAIYNGNTDAVSGPQGVPTDMTAFGNTFSVSPETVIFHDVDDNSLGFVDFDNLGGLAWSLSANDISENDTVTFAGSFTNDAQEHSLVITWGDGSTETITIPQGTFTFSVDHTYLDDTGNEPSDTVTYPLSFTLTDSSSASLSGSSDVNVANVAPAILSLTVDNVNENGTVTLSGTYSDIGTLDTHELTVDWADGSSETLTVTGGVFSVTHQYTDDNPTGTAADDYVINVTLADDDTGMDTASATTTVTNVAPVIDDISITTTVNENGVVVLSGTYSDQGTLDTHQLTINWGDGSTGIANISGGSFEITHRYFDDTPTGTASDNYTIDVTLTDDDLGTDTAQVVTTVMNVAPVVDTIEVTSTDENGVVTLSGTYSDVGTLDTHKLTIDWADGSSETLTVTGGAFSVTHQYLDDGPSGTAAHDYVINVTLSDDDLGTDTAQATTTITNVAPVVAITGAPVTSPEGTPITLTADVTEPGTLDVLSYTWTVTKDSVPYLTDTTSGASFTFTPDDNAEYIVTLEVSDDDLGVDMDTVTIAVGDVTPTVALSGAATTSEGQVYSVTLSLPVDPGTDTVTQYFVNWGDGSTSPVYYVASNPLPITLTHTYDDDAAILNPAAPEITVTLANEDGIFDNAGSLDITINNVAPTGIAWNTGPVNEGIQATVMVLTQSDPSTADTAAGFSYAYDFDNDGILDTAYVNGASSKLVPGSYLSDNPSQTVRVSIMDKDGGATDLFTTITINNVAPTINAGADAQAFVNQPFSRTLNFTDPGEDADWTITVDYGDGSPVETFDVSSRSLTLNHTFTSVDTNTVTITVMDKDGASSSDTFAVEVLADTFRVVDFTATASGFEVTFNRAPDLSVLNLYDGVDASVDLADLMVVGSATGEVRGSMTWNAATNTLSFVKTGGVLATDTYTVTLRSDADAFVDAVSGALLDGDYSYADGGDFVATFDVIAADRVLSLPDFARGAGQEVNIPATGSNLPITISDATGVRSIDFYIEYDPTLLDITSVAKSASLPAGWTLTTNLQQPGLLKVTVSGYTPLSGTNVTLVTLDAMVPTDAPYGSSEVVKLTNVLVNEGILEAAGDYAIHKAAYLGDVDGDGMYLAYDSSLISRVVVDLDGGFDAHDWTDPTIVGDTTGNGDLSGLDSSYVLEKTVGLPRVEIPDLPSGVTFNFDTAGIDPSLSIATVEAQAGETVNVPVSIDIEAGASVMSATFTVAYDTTNLSIDTSQIVSGEFWAGWSIAANEIEPGLIKIAISNTTGTEGPVTGEIAVLPFTVESTAPFGQYDLDLEKVGNGEGGLTWTASTDGAILLEKPVEVVGRYAFMNNSYVDGNDIGANADDDNAIITRCHALLPGVISSFSSVTSYSSGLNGIMIDLANAEASLSNLTAADFVFQMSTDGSTWTAAPAPVSITVRSGDGVDDSDRVTLIWAAEDAVKDGWLQVTTLATANTGLDEADTFYFGNLCADINGDMKVDGSDVTILAGHWQAGVVNHDATISMGDINGDAQINGSDVTILAGNWQASLPSISSFPSQAAVTPVSQKATQVFTPPTNMEFGVATVAKPKLVMSAAVDAVLTNQVGEEPMDQTDLTYVAKEIATSAKKSDSSLIDAAISDLELDPYADFE